MAFEISIEDAQHSIAVILQDYPGTRSTRPGRLSEEQVNRVSELLARANKKEWSRIPRIYAVLHMIDKVHVIDTFIGAGITDIWIPFAQRTLPDGAWSTSDRFQFIEFQDFVLTKAFDLEREDGKHRHFANSDEVPLRKLAELGKGGFGKVDRILSTITHREYARKRISRGKTFGKNVDRLRDFERELAHLKKLRHEHIVQLIGSYTDQHFVCILTYPVADYNLNQFLTYTALTVQQKSLLRTFYGCLANAVRYLHENRVRHKDIKPQNILVKGHEVFLTDFGISLDWSDIGQSTTTGNSLRTERYCAPEVAQNLRRNDASDLWSLGCVFLEIWTVLKGESLDGLEAHLIGNGNGTRYYHHNREAIAAWCFTLQSITDSTDEDPPLAWIEGTLQVDQNSRWSAQKLVACITDTDHRQHLSFLGDCCLLNEDSATSSTDSRRSSAVIDETGASSVDVYEPPEAAQRSKKRQKDLRALYQPIEAPKQDLTSKTARQLNVTLNHSSGSKGTSTQSARPATRDRQPAHIVGSVIFVESPYSSNTDEAELWMANVPTDSTYRPVDDAKQRKSHSKHRDRVQDMANGHRSLRAIEQAREPLGETTQLSSHDRYANKLTMQDDADTKAKSYSSIPTIDTSAPQQITHRLDASMPYEKVAGKTTQSSERLDSLETLKISPNPVDQQSTIRNSDHIRLGPELVKPRPRVDGQDHVQRDHQLHLTSTPVTLDVLRSKSVIASAKMDDKNIINWNQSIALQGHKRSVFSVAFSPDGKIIASGSRDRTIRLWDTASGECRDTLSGHSDWVYSVAFSPDGKTIASGSGDKTIRLRDMASGECRNTLSGHSNWVYSVAFSPDGKMIASGYGDETIHLWDMASRECRNTLSGHSRWVNSVAFSPDGKTIVSGSGDRTIRLWDMASGECRNTLSGHSDSVKSVAFSPDGKMIASGSRDETIRLWDTASGECRDTLSGHSDWVNSVAFSPDGKMIVSGSGDRTIRLWDTASGECRDTLSGHSDWVNSVAFSPDGKMIVSGSGDRTIRLWDMAWGECRSTLSGHSRWVNSVAFSPDGKTIVSGSGDKTIRLWDMAWGECRDTLSGHSRWANSVAFLPDRKTIVSGSSDNKVQLLGSVAAEAVEKST